MEAVKFVVLVAMVALLSIVYFYILVRVIVVAIANSMIEGIIRYRRFKHIMDKEEKADGKTKHERETQGVFGEEN